MGIGLGYSISWLAKNVGWMTARQEVIRSLSLQASETGNVFEVRSLHCAAAQPAGASPKALISPTNFGFSLFG